MSWRKIMAALACAVLIGGSVQALAASYGVNLFTYESRAYGEVVAVVPTATATITNDMGVAPQGVKLTNEHQQITRMDTSYPVASVSCPINADDRLEAVFTLRWEGTLDDKIVIVGGTSKALSLITQTPRSVQ